MELNMKPDATTITPQFKTAYSATETVAITFPPSEGRTKQEFRDDTDINNIMARFEKTGLVDFVNEHEPHYGDVTGLEFQTAMNQVIAAQALFDDLPANVRKRFNNEPEAFLDFVNDPQNLDEALRLGLVTKRPSDPTPEPKATEVALKPAGTASKDKATGD